MSDELKTAQVDADLGDMFSGMKKKKKAKKVVAEEEQPVQEPVPAKAIEIVNATAKPTPAPVPAPLEEPAVAPSEDLDFSDLKKKKKKKTVRIASDDEDDSLQPARTVDAFGNEIITESTTVIDATKEANLATADGDDEFADLKKKKRKGGKKSTFDLEAFEKELAEADASAKPSTDDATPAGSDGEDGEGVEGLDEVPEGEDPFTKAGEEEEGTLSRAEAAAEAKAWLKEDRDYTYTELLGRFYGLLFASHPSLSSTGPKKRYTLAPPSMHREGNKRSVFANIADICKKMHRSPEHVIMFLFAELGTSGSVDGAGRLVIKGRFQQKQIENVLRRYIVEWVTCRTCKSPDTQLTKDNRLFFVLCNSCSSSRSVSAIKSGFQAQTGKRRANRPAT